MVCGVTSILMVHYSCFLPAKPQKGETVRICQAIKSAVQRCLTCHMEILTMPCNSGRQVPTVVPLWAAAESCPAAALPQQVEAPVIEQKGAMCWPTHMVAELPKPDAALLRLWWFFDARSSSIALIQCGTVFSSKPVFLPFSLQPSPLVLLRTWAQ